MSNNFFNATGNPATASRALSAQVRSEFSSVEAGFLEVQDVVTAAINGSAVYAVDSGAANAYVVTVGTVDAAAYINAYTDGLMLRVRTANACTGASTINVNALGVKSIVRSDGSALQTGDIVANAPFMIVYNSAAGQFYLNMGIAGASGAAGIAGTSTSSVALPTSLGGSVSFTYVETGRTVSLGQFIVAAVTASPSTNWVEFQVTAFNTTTRQVTGTVLAVGGSGTYAAWTLSVCGAVGASGLGATATEQASGSVTLTAASSYVQYAAFTAHGQSFTFPDATTMASTGQAYCLVNPTQYFGQARDSAGKLVGLLPAMSTNPVVLANKATAAGKWSVAGSPLFGMTGLNTFTASLLGSTAVNVIPVWMDASRTCVVIGGSNLYAVVYNRATGAWGSATLIRSSIGSGGCFQAIKSATDQVLIVSVDATTGMEAVTLTLSGTGITVNSGTKGTATLAGNVLSTFTPNSDLLGLRAMAQYDATTFLIPYSRATNLSGLRAITISGTTPSIGAESTLGNLAGAAAHIHTSGTMIMAIAGGSANTAYCFTVSGNTLTATGNVALGVSTLAFFRTTALGTRWLMVTGVAAAASASASLISVAAGVPTATNVASVVTSTAGTLNASMDVQVANGKAVVASMPTDAVGVLRINTLTDTAGTISKGTELSVNFGTTGFAQNYSPVAAGSSGTDALFWWDSKILKVSASTASPTVSGVNLGAAPASELTVTSAFRQMSGRSNARPYSLLYSGSLAIMLPINPNVAQDEGMTVAYQTNASDSAPMRIAAPHAVTFGLNVKPGIPVASNTETWVFNQNTTSEPFTLSCFEAIQP
jgi:hypothetical protein